MLCCAVKRRVHVLHYDGKLPMLLLHTCSACVQPRAYEEGASRAAAMNGDCVRLVRPEVYYHASHLLLLCILNARNECQCRC